jgi:sec-independent protein translocase protein TatC
MFHNAMRLFLAFGLIFEMPLFNFFLAKLHIVTAARMRAWRKYAMLAIFIIAALITPPEVYSQLLLAGPMILLYEISIIIVLISQPKENHGTVDTKSPV